MSDPLRFKENFDLIETLFTDILFVFSVSGLNIICVVPIDFLVNRINGFIDQFSPSTSALFIKPINTLKGICVDYIINEDSVSGTLNFTALNDDLKEIPSTNSDGIVYGSPKIITGKYFIMFDDPVISGTSITISSFQDTSIIGGTVNINGIIDN